MFHSCFFSAIALAAVLALAGCTPAGPRALLKGKQLLEDGRYTEAVAELKTATSLLNTNAAAWNYLGVAEQHAANAAEAARAYQRALMLDPDLIEAHFNLGCLWLEQNRPDIAKTELTAYTLRHGNSSEGWLQLGEAQLRTRDLAAAQKSYTEALRLSPQNPEACNGLGMIEARCNRARDAALWFNAALKRQPDYAPALLNLAVVSQLHLDNRPLALQKYREYLALKPRPDSWQGVEAAARALEEEMNASRPAPTNAVATTAPVTNAPKIPINTVAVRPAPKPAASPAPDYPRQETAVRAATPQVTRLPPETEMKSARDASATPVVTTTTVASAASPGGPSAPQPEGGFFHRIFHREPRTPLKPTPIPSVRTLSEPTPVENRGESDAGPPQPRFPHYAYHSFTKPAQGDVAGAQRVFAQGARAHQEQRFDDAIEFYRQATQLDPAFYEAYYNLGLAASSSGKLPQALVAYEMALAIRPDSLDARYNFALALRQANYPADAANELEKILANSPNDARAHLALGYLYSQQLRQPAKAREHYEKFLQLAPTDARALAVRDWLYANRH